MDGLLVMLKARPPLLIFSIQLLVCLSGYLNILLDSLTAHMRMHFRKSATMKYEAKIMSIVMITVSVGNELKSGSNTPANGK